MVLGRAVRLYIFNLPALHSVLGQVDDRAPEALVLGEASDNNAIVSAGLVIPAGHEVQLPLEEDGLRVRRNMLEAAIPKEEQMRVHGVLDHQADPLLLLDRLQRAELLELYEGHLSKRIMVIVIIRAGSSCPGTAG